MRFLLPLGVIVTAAGLAGCSSAPSYYAYNGPHPAPSYSRSQGLYVPDHVASYSALPQSTYAAAAYTPYRYVAQRSHPAQPSGGAPQPRTDAVAVTNDQQDADAPLPFTPEWWAHEKATDDKLKKSLTICRGC